MVDTINLGVLGTKSLENCFSFCYADELASKNLAIGNKDRLIPVKGRILKGSPRVCRRGHLQVTVKCLAMPKVPGLQTM